MFKSIQSVAATTLGLIAFVSVVLGDPAPRETAFDRPHNQRVIVKIIGPYAEWADLQIICVLKHSATGDKSTDAIKTLDDKLQGLISQLRNSGEFAGEAGETLLITPPAGAIGAKSLLLIGAGDEADLSIDRLKLIGRVAAREAVRLKARHVAFAPTLRDQGSSRVDVGDGDAAFVSDWIAASETEKKLQDRGLSPPADVASLTIEAGPRYFDAVVMKVGQVVGKGGK